MKVAAGSCGCHAILPLVLFVYHKLDLAMFLERERHEWRAYVRGLHPDVKTSQRHSRGVIIIGGRAHTDHGVRTYYTLDALLAIAGLRRTGCRLPVELWHDHDQQLLDVGAVAMFGTLTNATGAVILRDLWHTTEGRSRTAYSLKPHVMMQSAFDEFLFLDADNVPIVDPTPLFSTEEYRATGAVFWADFKSIRLNHLVWEAIGREPLPTQLLDSGQMLVHKVRHWRALALADFFKQRWARTYIHPPFYFIGDKDMYLLAWLALAAPFHLAAPSGLVGFTAGEGALCGHSFIHGHPSEPNRPLFIHRVHAKWSSSWDYPHLRSTAIKRGRLTTDQPGTSPLSIGRSLECKPCPHHGPVGAEYRCFDLDTDMDLSAAAQEVLAQLARIEDDLLELASQISGGDATLRPQWWLPWARHLLHDRPEGSRIRQDRSYEW